MKNLFKVSLRQLSLVICGIIITCFLLSCDKFDSDQEVPSYIQIDSIGVVTEYDIQGTASHNISDAWVIVNGKLIGAFELPALVPVLESGLATVKVMAGIMQNGITATRIDYPFYAPIIKENFRLAPDSISLINGNVTYYQNTDFVWMEDFEGNLTLIKTSKSDTAIKRTSDPAEVFEGKYSGKISLSELKPYYQGAMLDAVNLPRLNSPIYLEINYKLDNLITVGLFSQGLGEIREDPILNVNKSTNWKKLYINLTPVVNRNTTALDFKVFIESTLGSELSNAEMYIDNIKLIHRKTN